MKTVKAHRRIETLEEILKREKRMARRESSIRETRKRRKTRQKRFERELANVAGSRQALQEDNKKEKIDNKKFDSGNFLSAFSFIQRTPFDRRNRIPPDFVSRSFNKDRQYIDFFKSFIHPYPVPPVLLFTSIQKEFYTDERGRNKKNEYSDIIATAKKWMRDITSGESFYRKNNGYFTKAESHFFLNNFMPYTGPVSVIELYFYAKCKARNMSDKRCTVISRVFTRKFEKYWRYDMVTGFMDLLARSRDYPIEAGNLGDICDFVHAKIIEHRKGRDKVPPFSFSGRTMTSIIALTNEWHAELLREQEALTALNRAGQLRQGHNPQPRLRTIAQKWNGIPVLNFNYEDDIFEWVITQLYTAQDLLNEGRKMKSCVSSYTASCASGHSAIFNVSRTISASQITESMATLEVSGNRSLVQAKAKCNIKVSPITRNIIRRWAQLNRIKIDGSVL
jgi:hypothetical protein